MEEHADYWSSSNTYVGLQILQQAIEVSGTLDKITVTDFIKNNTFDTIMEPINFENKI